LQHRADADDPRAALHGLVGRVASVEVWEDEDGGASGLRAAGPPHPGRAARQGDRGIDPVELHHVLNIIFLILAGAMCYQFARTAGIGMLKMMGGAPDTGSEHHAHAAH
jgi:hypothetical protein